MLEILAILIAAALFTFVGSLASAERGLLKRRIKRLEDQVAQLDNRTLGLTDIAEMAGALQRGQRARIDQLDEAICRIVENSKGTK